MTTTNTPTKSIFIITWHHSDGSGRGVTAAYERQELANHVLSALGGGSFVTYQLHEIELTS